MAINLSKGQRLSLEKEDSPLTRIELGANWGAITKKGLFGSRTQAVDLDASVGLFDEAGKLLDKVYFGKQKSKCRSILHSGDDRVGDTGGDDGEDNEVITVELGQVPDNVHHMALVLNSFNHIDFEKIPHASVRIHDGKATGNASVFAQFDVSNDASFSGKVSMILGDVYRHNGSWKFRSIGEAIGARDLNATLSAFAEQYL
ncbi:TerD family protein [Halomonas sp. I5-271120]|uniref:TerD family protein n=1 Tax=Halomonas sp. I5-271120 TaxID=3061632 RepID=UPI002714DCC3|nr:TerD family protein [Halomonas sp. I5-271120]